VSLLRLELIRLLRTHRLWILIGVFGFFGLVGPLTARYLPEIVARFGGGVEVAVPPPTPELAMAQYLGNALQIGILAVAFVAAASLAFDARLEMAVFLRTRARVRDIVAPRYLVNMLAAAVTFIGGSAVAFVGTVALIDAPDVGGTVLGTLLVSLYLCFSVALTGLLAGVMRSVPGVALVTVGALIALGIVGLVPALAPWLPSQLVGAYDALIAGGPFEYSRAVASTIVLGGAAIAGSVALLARREV
jgi:ABC-2 type transport system permease protein